MTIQYSYLFITVQAYDKKKNTIVVGTYVALKYKIL